MKPKLLILEGKNGPRVTAFCDGPSIRDAFEVSRSSDLVGSPDLVYCQTYGQRNSFEQLRKWNGPYVLHVGGDIWSERRERKRADSLADVMRVMWRSRRVVCVSDFLARVIRMNMGDPERAGHVTALPGGLWGTDHTTRGIDPVSFKPKDNWEIGGRPLVVMNINLTVRRKWRGVPIFMEATYRTLKKHGALVVCVGKVKGQWGLVKEWADRWGLQVIPPSSRWPELLRQADLFVHPSMFDGFPRSVAEVCCVGLPAVLFREGGTPEVCDSARLVNSGESTMINWHVEAMLNNRSERKKTGQAMRAEALAKTEEHRGDYAKMLLGALEG